MKQIVSVQILRGLAALLVVFGHAQHDALVQSLKLGSDFHRIFWLPWGAGVDLFFVISGFIMVYASEGLFGRPGAPSEFLKRRVARIAPLYWVFTALYLLVLLRASWMEGRDFPTLTNILASFAFWPTDAFGDGAPRPVFTLGWTLNYEMFFYVLFALCIGVAREKAVIRVGLILGGLVALGAAFQPSGAAPFFWSRPIVLEFALGMGVALLLRRGATLSSPVRMLLIAGSLAILVADPIRSGEQSIDWITANDVWRVLGWGMPAALIIAAAVLGPQGRPSRLKEMGTEFGNASYALYLSHPFVILGLRRVWLAAGLHERLGLWAMIAVSVCVSCLLALVIHRFVERPLTRSIQDMLVRRRFAAPAPAPV